MSCSKCKKKRYPELKNEPILNKIAFIDRTVVISMIILTSLALYGLYSLIMKIV